MHSTWDFPLLESQNLSVYMQENPWLDLDTERA